MKRLSGIIAVIYFLIAPVVEAQTAAERLDDFFNNVQVLQADFHQTVSDEKGVLVKEAEGTLIMQRPGRFRWDYVSPYRQLIVADGSKLWIYDGDLEQVTVKLMDTALGDTPALLLAGSKPLDEKFMITDLGESNGLQWVDLLPKAEDTSFERVRLGFGAQELQAMELLDSFGQTTRLDFSNLKRNQAIDAELFTFTPPPGVDVIDESH